MADTPPHPEPDLIEQIPDPDTVRCWLAESIRRSELLRSLLRVAVRKASYRRPSVGQGKEAAPCNG
jgi:hypothetical protein